MLQNPLALWSASAGKSASAKKGPAMGLYALCAMHTQNRRPYRRSRVLKLDHGKTNLVYCQIGVPSGRVLRLMKELGFKEIYNLAGGIIDWKEAGFPITE